MSKTGDIFIKNLKYFRKKNGISQMKLAELCDLSSGYISEIEAAKKFPTDKTIDKIANALNVKIYQLFLDGKLSDTDNEILYKKNLNDLKNKIIKNIDSVLNE